MTTIEHNAAWRDLRASGELGRFVVLCLGVWLHAADSLVTATVVPAMVAEIGGVPYVGWTISLYQIGAIVAGAATAMLCRRMGIKTVVVAASLAYGAGCALAALSPDMGVLLGARLVQGLGGGALITLTYVAIQQSFAEHLWGRLFGIVAMIWAVGSLLGPLIGGVFADLGNWRLAFWFFAAQGVIVAIMATASLKTLQHQEARAGRWPLAPLALLSAATLLIAEAGVDGRVCVAVVECLAGIALLYAAARLDRRSNSRLLPGQLLELRRPLGAGLMTVFALAVATTGFWAYGPLILTIMFGTDPLVAGYILAGEALAWSTATLLVSGLPLSAQKLLIGSGVTLVVIGTAAFAVAVPAGSLIGMVLCGLLQGIGFGIAWPSIVQRTVSFADDAEKGLAAAAPGTIQRIGFAVGAAATGIAGNMSGLAEGISPEAARNAGFWVFAGFVPVLAIAMLCVSWFVRGDIAQPSETR
jgi:MFS family permease